MKILLLQLTLFLFVFNIKAQSNKEIISTLNIQIDSLNSELKGDSIYPLDENDIPFKLKASAEACTDCFWYEYSDFEMGELLFLHDPIEDKLYFNFQGVINFIPIKSREFKDGSTETGLRNGTGTLLFEGDGITIVLEYSQAGFAFGSEGVLTIFKSGKEIKNLTIRCNF